MRVDEVKKSLNVEFHGLFKWKTNKFKIQKVYLSFGVRTQTGQRKIYIKGNKAGGGSRGGMASGEAGIKVEAR